MSLFRRDFLKWMTHGAAGVATAAVLRPGAHAQAASLPDANASNVFDVKHYGATGDGKTIDTPAINRAIAAAAKTGGGTVRFPAGTYACYSIHLMSHVALYLENGAIVLAADVPEG